MADEQRRECPMCGETLQPKDRVLIRRIPGTSEETKRTVREWVCPECDYFEEDEGDTTAR